MRTVKSAEEEVACVMIKGEAGFCVCFCFVSLGATALVVLAVAATAVVILCVRAGVSM